MAKERSKCCTGTCDGRVQRWPGFVGPDYAEGGVLLVGLNHHGQELFKPVAMQRLQNELLRSTKSKKFYLIDLPRAYIDSAKTTWIKGNVWGRFDQIREHLNVEWEQVAFTNLAKCFDGNHETVLRKCLKTYPLTQLVGILKPAKVFIACSRKSTRYLTPQLEREHGCQVWQYDNRTGQMGFFEWLVKVPLACLRT